MITVWWSIWKCVNYDSWFFVCFWFYFFLCCIFLLHIYFDIVWNPFPQGKRNYQTHPAYDITLYVESVRSRTNTSGISQHEGFSMTACPDWSKLTGNGQNHTGMHCETLEKPTGLRRITFESMFIKIFWEIINYIPYLKRSTSSL